MTEEKNNTEEITEKTDDFASETKENVDKKNDSENLKKKSLNENNKIFWAVAIGKSNADTFFFSYFSPFVTSFNPSNVVIGFITAIQNLLGSLFQSVFGKLSDKYGRKIFLILGFIMSSLPLFLLIFYPHTAIFITVAIMEALATSLLFPVLIASIGDVTTIRGRAFFMGRIFGIGQTIAVAIQFIVGIIFYLSDEGKISFGSFILTKNMQYNICFAFAIFNYLLCFIILFFFKETNVHKEKVTTLRTTLALKDKNLMKFIIINSTYGLMMSFAWPVFTIIQIDILKMPVWQLSIYNVSFAVFIGLAQFFGGKISDKIGRKPLLLVGRISLFSIAPLWILAIYYSNWYILFIEGFITGIAVGLVNLAVSAYTLDLAPEEMRGTYSGLVQMSFGILAFIGSMIGGGLAQYLENIYDVVKMAYIILIISGIIRLIASFGYFFIKENFNRNLETVTSK